MALAEGDYLKVEAKVVETLLADTEAGGLRESGSPAVSLIRAGDPGLSLGFGQAEYPAILVRAVGKTESPSSPSYARIKEFAVKALILVREQDRERAEEAARRIAARVESRLREQTAMDQQFRGLPDEIEGAEGFLACELKETRFPETVAKESGVLARAEVSFQVQVPCLFRGD